MVNAMRERDPECLAIDCNCGAGLIGRVDLNLGVENYIVDRDLDLAHNDLSPQRGERKLCAFDRVSRSLKELLACGSKVLYLLPVLRMFARRAKIGRTANIGSAFFSRRAKAERRRKEFVKSANAG